MGDSILIAAVNRSFSDFEFESHLKKTAALSGMADLG